MTGQPVNLAVTAEASLPAPIASASIGGESFRVPEKRIHNQAELDRHVALPQPCADSLCCVLQAQKLLVCFTARLLVLLASAWHAFLGNCSTDCNDNQMTIKSSAVAR